MNIREAKDELRRTVEIYLDTNEHGEYTIPYRKQRPVFMVGAPGIGKTGIVEQTASEMGIALVSCSVTHHTRQSALGLPYMAKKEYDGRVWQISEYAMGEILHAVYETMEESGKKEGILFLDEINCASESLAPAMLSLLQYKKLGNKHLPEGWIIVAAGCPPEYGNGIRRFETALLDRLKCFKVEADFGAWKSFAYQQGIHGAVIAFLEINPNCFYSMYAGGDKEEYATARGWEDLARELQAYEKKGFQVDERLIFHYITDRKIGRMFGTFYELFRKCRIKYSAEEILGGNGSPDLIKNAAEAETAERIILLNLLLEMLNRMLTETVKQEKVGLRVGRLLRIAKRQIEEENLPLYAVLYTLQEQLREEKKRCQAANSMSDIQREEYRRSEELLADCLEKARKEKEPKGQLLLVEKEMDALAEGHEEQLRTAEMAVEQALAFLEEVWGSGWETELFRCGLAGGSGNRGITCADDEP